MARTGGRGGGEAGGNEGRGGNEGIEGTGGKEACLETDRGTGLTEGTRDFAGGSIHQSSATGRFLFRIGREGTREMGTGLTCS